MRIPVLTLDVPPALLTLVRLVATILDMSDPLVELECFAAKGTLPGLELAIFFMRTEFVSRCSERAVLTSDWLVRSLLVLLSLGLGDDLATLATLVVISGTSDLVHAELRDWDGLLASAANLGLFFCCFCHYAHQF